MTDGYKLLAEASILLSISTILILVATLPNIYDYSDLEYEAVVEKSAKFKKSSDEVWEKIVSLREQLPSAQVNFFSRSRRSDWMNGAGFCRGCFTLACPMGMSGPPGAPGPDGQPGDAGKPGRTGDDGYDVILETEPDMPCVVCPAGPPGQRGAQGERGMPGVNGMLGGPGPHGSDGMEGPLGPEGLPGPAGLQGPVGPKGPQGDTLIAGVGVKGPVGPPGPMGMKGRPGPPGKSSNTPGVPGNPGTIGAIGQTGKMGGYGMEGPYGPPGDAGMPASYCPSDCGIQNILTEMFPTNAKAKLSEYQGPPGAAAQFSQGESYGVRTNRLSAFERRLRKKMIRKMLALKKYRQ